MSVESLAGARQSTEHWNGAMVRWRQISLSMDASMASRRTPKRGVDYFVVSDGYRVSVKTHL